MPLQHNVACALCYLFGGVTGVLFLLMEPYSRSREIRFHAWQSILLNVLYFATVVLFRITWFLPFIGRLFILGLVLAQIVAVGLWLYLMFTAFNGQKVKLPILGDMAERQA